MENCVMAFLILLAAVLAVTMFMFLQRINPGRWIQSVRDGVNGHDYGGLPSKLIKSGVADKISPPAYRFLQCILGLVSFAALLGRGIDLSVCIAGSILFMLLPGFLIRAQVKKENLKMLSDIEHLYNLLYLQRRAGAFFTDSLIDAYRVVSHWRLKKALIDLVGAINGKKTISEATEEFANKFDNPYITSLADIIRHGVEEGNNSEMLSDVTDQIIAIQQAQYKREQGKQDLKNIALLTTIFIGVIAGICFLAVTSLGDITKNLFY